MFYFILPVLCLATFGCAALNREFNSPSPVGTGLPQPSPFTVQMEDAATIAKATASPYGDALAGVFVGLGALGSAYAAGHGHAKIAQMKKALDKKAEPVQT